MSTTLFSLSLLLVLVHSVLAQSTFTVNTPSLVQCQPSNITWSDTGNSPYELLVVPADDMCGVALVSFSDQTATTVTWTVNLAAGTQVVLYVEDAVANDAWSGTITVGDSNDTSCLTSTTSTPSGTALTVPPSSGGVATATTPSSSPASSAYSPVGAAGAGIVPASGALSTSPLSVVTLLGPAVLGVLAFAL